MIEHEPLTISAESYLDVIHDLSHKGPVRSVDVAERLNVTKVSVNKALRVLKQAGYVVQQPYQCIELTEAGVRHAHRIAWRHEVTRSFLRDVLGVSPEVADADACRIEHVISDETVSRLEAFIRKASPNEAGSKAES